MIKEDVIEGVIALPPKLFYDTPIPGCVLILNRNRPESHRNKIIFIYATREYEEGKIRNKLRESDVQRIVLRSRIIKTFMAIAALKFLMK